MHKRPVDKSWKLAGYLPALASVSHGVYRHEDLGLQVISAVEVVPDVGAAGPLSPHFHISCVRRVPGMVVGSRVNEVCSDEELERVRAGFGMGGAEEDNHGEGSARHLWLKVGASTQPECPCKQDEDKIVEGDRVRYE